MTILVTGTPGSGKTTLVAHAQQNGDGRFYDADEIPGLCEWREFKTGKVMGLVADFVKTGHDDWYATYGWYWCTEVLRQFLVDHPDAIICGSSENVAECYELFEKLVIIQVEEKELISNLAQPTRNNPFGKTPKQRANFMNWQDYLIESAEKYNPTICSGNDTHDLYKTITRASKHYVLYSHGFGVTKTDRGLFSDISKSMPDMVHLLFDYNKIDSTNNILTVSTLQDQLALFEKHLSDIEEDATIDVIAHSQGCLVVAMARSKRVRKTLFLAPPDSVDIDRLISFFGDRPNSTIDLTGESRISRRDGSTTIIPVAYWRSIEGLDPIRRYNQLAEVTRLTLFIATDDEVLGYSSFEGINDEFIRFVEIRANHDFTGEARNKAIELIKSELGF